MKPKLAIYGDSWAGLGHLPFKYRHVKQPPVEHCWINNPVLVNNYEVTVFSTKGLDFYSTYKVFKETHHKFDHVVFIVTESTRQSFNYKNSTFLITPGRVSIDVDDILSHCDPSRFKNEDLVFVKDLIKSVELYLLHVAKFELFDAGVAKLIDEMIKVKPNAVVIPAFQNNFIPGTFLCEIEFAERKAMGLLGSTHEDFHDIRHAHMTSENNEIFANYIYRRLCGENIELSLDMFVMPSPDEKSKYFIEL